MTMLVLSQLHLFYGFTVITSPLFYLIFFIYHFSIQQLVLSNVAFTSQAIHQNSPLTLAYFYHLHYRPPPEFQLTREEEALMLDWVN